MIERYLFVKLKPEHGTALGCAEVRERAARLAGVGGVAAATVGVPADAGAKHAWDLSVTLRFASRDHEAHALADPAYLAFTDGYLAPRAAVVKAWSFELGPG